MTTDPTAASVEERVARHLAAKDWLVEPGNAWARRGKKFREDYLALAREVIALVQPPAVSVPPPPPATRATLRDRIADVLAATDGWRWATDFDKARSSAYRGYQTRAAAVLGVLPPPADRTAVCICGHTEQQHFEDACITEVTGCQCGDYLPPDAAREVIARWREAATQARADRAAVLNAAAQRLYTALFPAVYADMGQKAAEGVNRAVSELRRMADEEQPATEAPPSDDHAAIYLDEDGDPWVEYLTRPRSDHVVPLVIDSVEAVDRSELEARIGLLTRIGWCKQ